MQLEQKRPGYFLLVFGTFLPIILLLLYWISADKDGLLIQGSVLIISASIINFILWHSLRNNPALIIKKNKPVIFFNGIATAVYFYYFINLLLVLPIFLGSLLILNSMFSDSHYATLFNHTMSIVVLILLFLTVIGIALLACLSSYILYKKIISYMNNKGQVPQQKYFWFGFSLPSIIFLYCLITFFIY